MKRRSFLKILGIGATLPFIDGVAKAQAEMFPSDVKVYPASETNASAGYVEYHSRTANASA